MLTVVCLLALVAFVGTIAAAYNKAPLWIAVLTIAELLRCLPLA